MFIPCDVEYLAFISILDMCLLVLLQYTYLTSLFIRGCQ